MRLPTNIIITSNSSSSPVGGIRVATPPEARSQLRQPLPDAGEDESPLNAVE